MKLGRICCGLAGLLLSLSSMAAEVWNWQLPSHVPAPRVPQDNPMSAAKVELGRHLFYDPRLSGNGTQSCATCHVQTQAFSDGKALSTGSTGGTTHRNAPGLANVAWHATYNWANPAIVTLERQMEVPLFGDDPVEMGITDGNRAQVLQRLRDEPRYPPLFAAAFPEQREPLSMGSVIKAIAAFERSLVAVDSRYDRYLQGQGELTAAELRGKDLFFGEKAECHHCHGSFNFNDQVVHARSRQVEMPFHNTGLYNLDGEGAYPFPNRGVFEFSGEPRDMGAFRAPSLRNVALTAPYFHDGSAATLREVLGFYSQGGRNVEHGSWRGDGRLNPYKSGLIVRVGFSEQEIEDLLAFLHSLTDESLLRDPTRSDPWRADSRLTSTP